jgi:hypothetical protein
MTIQPIELLDDGLRVPRVGQVRGFPMVCLHNPGLIAEVAAIKAMRRVIRDANERAFA